MNALTRAPQRGWNMFGEFDDLVNGMFVPIRQNDENVRAGQAMSPALDITETEQGYLVQANLPGIAKEDLNVSVKDDVLVIEADSQDESVEKDGDKVIKRERYRGRYVRSLQLGKSVDESKITAQYTDGVLKLTLPKAEQSLSRKIEVAVH